MVAFELSRRTMVFRAPLLGYNTNVRHKGRLYHIQTEDSGIGHPHVITHLFADGGRILASKKTGYAEHLGSSGLQDTVKKLMQAQHKAMFISLRDGIYDDNSSVDATAEATGTHQVVEAAPAEPAKSPELPEAPRERARHDEAAERKPLYQNTLSATQPTPAAAPAAATGRQSIFGSDLLSEKSLDEVILSYLATDDKD
jgi:hypothetical protein